MSSLKRYGLLMLCVVFFGIVIGILKEMFAISDDIFWKMYYIGVPFVIMGCIGCNFCYHRYYVKKMRMAIRLLENKEFDQYIALVQELRQKAKGEYLQTLFTVNLSVGYSAKKDYEKAIALLESVSTNRMYHVLKMCHKLNLCYNYYMTNQREKSKEIYQNSLKLFQQFRKIPPYGGNIAVLDLLMELENQNFDWVQEQLAIVREEWKDPNLEADYLYIEEALQMQQG